MALGDDLLDARVGTVRLVDDQNHRKRGGERLAQHEAGLRQRALGGVDEQDDTVDHGQSALDLTAEVGVAGGIDHVDDGDGSVGVAFVDGRVLGQNRDAFFFFEVARVHDAVDRFGAFLERSGLPEHGVDQRGLAMVDVCNDGYVAERGGGIDVVCTAWGTHAKNSPGSNAGSCSLAGLCR